MKVVIAPDKMKGCLTAAQVARAVAAGVLRAAPDAVIDEVPLADGGEGFVDAMVVATGGTTHAVRVTGPLPEMRVDAIFGRLGGDRSHVAVIEMSSASGLHLLRPDQYDPSATTTFGTGELIRAAVAMGCREVLLGIGGSATTDGGIGCAQACGLPVLLAGGEPTYDTEPLCGRDVEKVVLVKHGRGSPVDGVKITVACDVTNPLFGTNGAAMVYGPQKGGTPAQLRELDAALKKLATRQNALDVANTPGAGAAGGLGFGMMAFFGATLVPGAKLVIDATGLRDRLAGADLCVTVEGRADATSSAGKTTHAVAALCKELGVPCVVLAGGVGEVDGLLAAGATAVLSVCDGPMSLGQATAEAGRLLGRAAEMVTRLRLAAAVGPGRQTSG